MRAPVGAWAEYQITKDDPDANARVRYTLVARDKKQVAIVLDTSSPTSHVVIKMTFVPDDKDATRWNLAAARMKTGDGTAKDMPIPGQRDAKSASFAKSDAFGTLVGKERLKLAASSIEASHFHKEGSPATDVWMSDAILPVGLVKLEGAGGHVELVATGKGGSIEF
jgi:hypothetical protein